jgi:hypothetical protein
VGQSGIKPWFNSALPGGLHKFESPGGSTDLPEHDLYKTEPRDASNFFECITRYYEGQDRGLRAFLLLSAGRKRHGYLQPHFPTIRGKSIVAN